MKKGIYDGSRNKEGYRLGYRESVESFGDLSKIPSTVPSTVRERKKGSVSLDQDQVSSTKIPN